MGPTLDSSLTLLVGVLVFVIALALYVWVALALAAMFRKMGEEAWKGWVPLLNQATVLKWGGFNPWLILLLFVPVAGQIVVGVLLIISAHRINPGFGYGTGMTVLSALLFVVWASILGFGPAPWRGSRKAFTTTAFPAPPRPPLPPSTLAASPAASTTSAASPFSAAPRPVAAPGISAAQPGSPAMSDVGAESARRAAAGTASAAASAHAPAAARTPEPSSGAEGAPGWAPPLRPFLDAPSHEASSSRGSSEGSVPPSPPANEPDVASWPSEIDDVSAVSPSPFPPSAAAARSVPSAAPVTEDDGLISFVPGRRSNAPAAPAAPPLPPAVVPPSTPVTRTPAATRTGDSAAGAPLGGADPDGFPELTGEVSAVVGSPAAGSPISARSSVSAQQRVAQEPGPVRASADAETDAEDVDQTVMVRRKKITWNLVPAIGSPIALTAEVVILGRRPVPDTAFPGAQLVAVHDEARTVSKTHARLELRGEKWLVTDLGSTNGVLLHSLMGEEIEVEPGTELEAGERFYLGDEEFHLQHG